MIESFVHRPTSVEINLDNLAQNYQSIRKFVGKNLGIMAVVKADAYGHGAICCARRLESEGIEWLGVALPEEGLELRENGITAPILCLGSFWNGQENLLLENNLTPVVYQIEKAASFNRAALEKNIIADVHVKIDTGMGRIGVRFDEVEHFTEKLKELKNLRVDGIMTHFAAADNLSETEFTTLQVDRYNNAVAIFAAKNFHPTYFDLANSPGAIAHPKARGNLIRIGGILYGLGGDVLPAGITKPQLKPVMALRTKIANLKSVPKGETLGYSRTFTTERNSMIATIPIGYQDGFPRTLSNKGRVIIKGRFVPVVGRVSMDWTILDVTEIPDVQVEDEVILIGETENLKVTAEEIAQLTDTISYEITCGINRRVYRKYVGS